MRYTYVPWIASFLLRLSLGLSMILVGIAAYRDFGPYSASVSDGLATLYALGAVWSYLLPACLILGGGLLIYGRATFVAAWTGGIALGSIPVGLLLKTLMSAIPLTDMLQALFPYLLWMLLFYHAVNMPVLPVEKDDD